MPPMSARLINRTLYEFEAALGLGPTYAARLIGVAYPTYAQYRSLRRELPLYHSRHIEVLQALPHAVLEQFIKEHAHGYITA